MSFKAGDRIKFLNEIGQGVILKLEKNNMAVIMSDDGFEYVLNVSEIVGEGKSVTDQKLITSKLSEFNTNDPKKGIVFKNSNDKPKISDFIALSRKKWTSRNKDFVEIDLHIEELIEKPAFLSDGEKLNYQLNFARTCLNEAYEGRIKRIVFIHGVGSGILRHELRKWLSNIQDVEFFNADYKMYGIGATEVRIKKT